MFGFTRLAVLMAMIVVSGILAGISVGIAQTSPPVDPEPPRLESKPTAVEPKPAAAESKPPAGELHLPAGQIALPEFELESPAREAVKNALRGKLQAGETGDIVWDEMMKVIRLRGSVLDGSSLDSLVALSDDSSDSDEAQRAFAAELLLRASRTLEQIGSVDNTRQKLVREMRDEAGRLLAP